MMMQLMRIVLERTARRSRYSSDGLLHRVSSDILFSIVYDFHFLPLRFHLFAQKLHA